MYCPWWQCHEAAVIKMAYTVERGVLLVKRFYQATTAPPGLEHLLLERNCMVAMQQ
jgi:hypothetical protein